MSLEYNRTITIFLRSVLDGLAQLANIDITTAGTIENWFTIIIGNCNEAKNDIETLEDAVLKERLEPQIAIICSGVDGLHDNWKVNGYDFRLEEELKRFKEDVSDTHRNVQHAIVLAIAILTPTP